MNCMQIVDDFICRIGREHVAAFVSSFLHCFIASHCRHPVLTEGYEKLTS